MVLEHQYEQSRFIIGAGALSRLNSVVETYGCTRLMIVAGETTGTNSELIDPILNAVGDKHVHTFSGCKEDVPLSSVERGIELVRQYDIDGLISLGGGSNHDTAKAIAELDAEQGNLHDVKAKIDSDGELIVPDNPSPKDPIFTVSTTLTGAEVTNSVSVTDETRHEKTVTIDDQIRPVANFYEPGLTRTTPNSVLTESGMNAIDHAVEILYSSTLGENPFYQATAEKAIQLLQTNLPAVVNGTADTESIANVHIGACMSAMDITKGYCINHSINHGICARYPVHHGQGDSILLPHGLRFNFEVVPDRIRRISSAFGVADENMTDREALEALISRIHQIQDTLELPNKLREVGVRQDEFDEVAAQVSQNPGIKHNPRKVTVTDIIDILDAAW